MGPKINQQPEITLHTDYPYFNISPSLHKEERETKGEEVLKYQI